MVDDNNGQTEPPEVDTTNYICSQLPCQVKYLTIKIPGAVSASLDYVQGETWDDNLLRAYTNENPLDCVGWIGFDLSAFQAAIPIRGMCLFVYQANVYDSPTLDVVYSDSNQFTRTGVTLANMPRTQVVSASNDVVSVTSWDSFVIDTTARDFGQDLSDGRMTLGFEETHSDYRYTHYLGTDDPATRPYLKVDMMLC